MNEISYFKPQWWHSGLERSPCNGKLGVRFPAATDQSRKKKVVKAPLPNA